MPVEMMVHCKYTCWIEAIYLAYEAPENPSEEQGKYLEIQIQGNPGRRVVGWSSLGTDSYVNKEDFDTETEGPTRSV